MNDVREESNFVTFTSFLTKHPSQTCNNYYYYKNFILYYIYFLYFITLLQTKSSSKILYYVLQYYLKETKINDAKRSLYLL